MPSPAPFPPAPDPSTGKLSQRRGPYDWRSQWYPVCYLEDLRDSPGPIRVSLFDEPIAVALKDGGKQKKGEGRDDDVVIALEDRCSHRGAALSEGRVTAAGCLQCPYHAWTFDAGGSCVAIPHAPGAARREAEAAEAAEGGTRGASARRGRKTDVRAYAAAVSQGLVWLSPGPPGGSAAPPPLSSMATLPELDLPGWVSDDFVRDFDGIDFPLLVQNVADPDHGLFAHQTPSFDAFSAAVGMPMRVASSATRIVGRVEAAPVLTRGSTPSSSPSPPSSSSSVAELVFEPPCHVRWARMDGVEEGSEEGGGGAGGGGGEAKFIAAVR